MTQTPLTVLRRGVTVELVLDRPPVNALDLDLKQRLHQVLAEIAADRAVRCVLIRSAVPRRFCAGSDLAELVAEHDQPGAAWDRTRFEYDLWEASLSALPQPSIAVVEGYALGSGMELAIACDIRITGPDATFGLPEIKIGGAPGIQSITRLVSMVGLTTARRMLLLGQSVGAEEAANVGLVDEVVPAEETLTRARALADEMADLPASSVKFIKRALSAALSPAMERVHRQQHAEVADLFTAPEMSEGISAFLERRDPDFYATVQKESGHE